MKMNEKEVFLTCFDRETVQTQKNTDKRELAKARGEQKTNKIFSFSKIESQKKLEMSKDLRRREKGLRGEG